MVASKAIFTMKSLLATAAVLLPHCLAIAVDANQNQVASTDAAQVVDFPEYEADIFWGEKHRRVRDPYDGGSVDIEHMIRDLGTISPR